ncbi:unnamed protein product, partial [Staurois parvus]
MWGNQRVNCVLFYYVCCVCFSVSTLLCMALPCRAIQSHMQELTGERSVYSFTYRSLPHQKPLEIA